MSAIPLDDAKPSLSIKPHTISVELGLPTVTLVRIPRDTVDDVAIRTPDPHLAQMWILETPGAWILALNEGELADAVARERGTREHLFDVGAVAGRIEFAQSPLIGTVLNDCWLLPPQVELVLRRGRSVVDALRSVRSLIAPIPCQSQDLVDLLLMEYRKRAPQGQAVVTLSAGWDSRLEATLLRAALGPKAELTALHLRTSPIEEQVARRVAEQLDMDLWVFDPAEMLSMGLKWPDMWRGVENLPTWRPTIPMYGAMFAAALSLLGTVPWFGYTSFPLKGRDYDQVLEKQPSRAKRRLREIEPAESIALGGQTEPVLNQQREHWSMLLRVTNDWESSAQHDYLNWAAGYGISYSSRLRALPVGGANPVLALSPIVSAFAGLPAAQKAGTAFIEYALNALQPDLLKIPVIASSGDGNRGSAHQSYGPGTTPIGGDRDSPTVTRYPCDGPPERERMFPLESDFYAAEFQSLCTIQQRGRLPELARAVLDVGTQRGGPARVNAYQLAQFIGRFG